MTQQGRRLPILLGVLTLGVLLAGSQALAQESQSDKTSVETAPTQSAPTQTAPTEVPPITERPKETAPPEATTLANEWPDITGLVMQPLYTAVRIPVALAGGLVGSVMWALSCGDYQAAQKVWDTTVRGAWGWPEFVRGRGIANGPPK